MKILVAAFITALLVFTLATAWVEVVQPRWDILTAASQKTSESVAKSSSVRSRRRTVASEIDDESSVAVDSMPRLSARPSRDDVAPASASKVRDELDRIRKQDQKLAAREETLQLLFDDIRAEMSRLNELRRSTSNEVVLAGQRVRSGLIRTADAEPAMSDVASEQPAMTRETRAETQADRMATVIQKLAKEGSIPIAATLLGGIKEREAARVLASLYDRDRPLATRLAIELQSAKAQTTIRR